MMRDRVMISFSGGRSSAVMTKMVHADCVRRGIPVVTVFANTGAEHPATLDFVRDVETHWSIPIVWVEAVTHKGERKGSTHKVVTYETASRDGEPFRLMSHKYGMPGPAFPNCTRELKLNPIKSYLRSIGWSAGSYTSAIGIRADEVDRIRIKELDSGEVFYPLVDAGITKEMVGAIMASEPFDLRLPGDHYGNCVTCYKKTSRKLMTIAQDDPSWFDLFKRIEDECAELPFHGMEPQRRPFFRKHMTVRDMLKAAKDAQFDRYEDSRQLSLYDLGMGIDDLDVGGGCGESCEIFADDA